MRKMLYLVVAMLVLVGTLQAQPAKMWKAYLQRASKCKIQQVTASQGVLLQNVPLDKVPHLLKICQKLQVLSGPDCRCLPNVSGHLVFFMQGGDLLVLQLVAGHWFQAFWFQDGQAIPFFLKDPKGVLTAAIKALFPK